MKKICLISFFAVIVTILITSFTTGGHKVYLEDYFSKIENFRSHQELLIDIIRKNDIQSADGKEAIKSQLGKSRNFLKTIDFWLRYLEPTVYKQVNGPLPVEWETEVFEKFEAPYKRQGAGLTLAEQYLEEDDIQKDSLVSLIESSISSMDTYSADSITVNLKSFHHFYLCNRLFLLNLAAIYTTGFECPDTSRVIPELRLMLGSVEDNYYLFNDNFPATSISNDYLSLYHKAILFATAQPDNYSLFDHYTFIRDYINPLFALNQQFIKKYRVMSRSFVDYSLNKNATSIFDKKLYDGQNAKGIFLRVYDENGLAEIEKLGKLLFYDPILSGNNRRSCISCHKPRQYFTDTAAPASLQFDKKDQLQRNSPSLVNAVYNHLIMLDGKHISLQDQVKDVINNPSEMGGNENEIVKKILSCPDYKKSFTKLLEYTPWETEITLEHITSCITFYYSKFSNYEASFDIAMNKKGKDVPASVKAGFNIFMSKAQCATCHFVPQFNGVKPPYVGSEFEVLGVPEDTTFKKLSLDSGRYTVNPAPEMLDAFRTGSLRNIGFTAPYMHNGVFKTLNEVIDFYDAGGGIGKGMQVVNQTLPSDSLKLNKREKADLVIFLKSLNENIVFEGHPAKLPSSSNKAINSRKVGGEY